MPIFKRFLQPLAQRIRLFVESQWAVAGPLKLATVGIAVAVAAAESAFRLSRGAVPSAPGVILMACADLVLPWAFVWFYIKYDAPPPAPEFQLQVALMALGLGMVSTVLAF